MKWSDGYPRERHVSQRRELVILCIFGLRAIETILRVIRVRLQKLYRDEL